MRDEKVYTEREKVLAERAAFVLGVGEYQRFREWPHDIRIWAGDQREAATRYPLPKVTRPRVVADPRGGAEWRVVGGIMQSRHWEFPGWGIWTDRDFIKGPESQEHRAWIGITPERVALWADLLANPTEEVETEP